MSRLDDLLRAAEDLLQDVRDDVVSNIESRGHQLIQEMGQLMGKVRRSVMYNRQRLDSELRYVYGEA